MSNTDDALKRLVAAMGEPLGQLFHAISTELTWTSWTHQELRELFGTSSARLHLINSSAPFFFYLVQRTWWEDVLLAVSRLLGPPSSRGKRNLSAMHLPAAISDTSLQTEVRLRLEKVQARASFAKIWRDQHIAHRDLDRALQNMVDPLPNVAIEDVEEVLQELAAILNRVELHYTNGTTAYGNSPISTGASTLLYLLRDAQRFEQLRQERVERGEYDPREFHDGEPPL